MTAGTVAMVEVLQRMFKVHRGEAGKVISFALLGALLEAGVAVGISSADTLFLVHVGADRLPVVYILLPVLMVAFTPAFSYLSTRFGIGALLRITFLALIAGGVVSFIVLLVFGSEFAASLYILKLYVSLWSISLFTLYWNYVDRYFDLLDAKRLFSVLAGGAACGAVLGGGLVTLLAGILQVEGLLLVWSLLALLALPVVAKIDRTWRIIEVEEEPESSGFLEQTIAVSQIVKKSRYVVLLNAVLMLSVFLGTVCEFQYLGFFSESTEKTELAVLFGTLFAITNIFNLIVNFFLFSRLVGVLGVRNVVLIQPLTFLVAFSLLYWNYGWIAAIFGFFAYQGIMTSIENNNWNFVMNGVPSDFKSQVRTFTEGITEPVAASLGGVFLLFFASGTAESQISATGWMGSFLLVVVALWLSRDYLGAIITNLRREWLDFSRSSREIVRSLDESEVEELRVRALQSSGESAQAALHFLILRDPRLALDTLLGYLGNGGRKERDELQILLSEILRDAEIEVLTTLVRSLGSHEMVSESTFVEVLGAEGLIQSQTLRDLLESKDPREKAAAAVAHWNSWNLPDGVRALSIIQELLERSDEEKLAGIRALGQLRQERYAHFLAQFLSDESQEVRCQALASIRALVNRDSTHLVGELLRVIRGGDNEERLLALEVLDSIRDSACLVQLLSLEAGLAPQERRKVEKLALRIGLGSVPTMVSILRDPGFDYQARSIAARSLSKLAFPQFESLLPDLIQSELERAFRYLYYHYTLAGEKSQPPGLAVLSLFYRDARLAMIEFVLEILTLGGRLPDFELISSSLRSKSAKVRANAIESVEQACSRGVFKRLLPLVDSRGIEDCIAFYQQHFQPDRMNAVQIVNGALRASSDLEASAAAQAAWEMNGDFQSGDFRARPPSLRSRLYRETVLSLLRRTNGSREMNAVETIFQLSRAAFFEAFGIEELAIFARHRKNKSFSEGETLYRRGDKAGQVYIVLEGAARSEDKSRTWNRAGEVFGEESLYGDALRQETAVSEGLEAIVLDASQVRNEVDRYPRIAIGILENCLVG